MTGREPLPADRQTHLDRSSIGLCQKQKGSPMQLPTVLGRCPVCANELQVTRLHCPHCDTGIDGPLPAVPLPAPDGRAARLRRGLPPQPRHHQGRRGRAWHLVSDGPGAAGRGDPGDGLPVQRGGRTERPRPGPGPGGPPPHPGAAPGQADLGRRGPPPASSADRQLMVRRPTPTARRGCTMSFIRNQAAVLLALLPALPNGPTSAGDRAGDEKVDNAGEVGEPGGRADGPAGCAGAAGERRDQHRGGAGPARWDRPDQPRRRRTRRAGVRARSPHRPGCPAGPASATGPPGTMASS